ncbi:MAG: class I SAM-dependent methyltransferase [Thermoleophilia bacterium]
MKFLRSIKQAINPPPKEYHHTIERVCPDFPDENFDNHVRVYEFGMQFVPGKDVLDVGCGTGYGSHLFSTKGARSVLAIDFSDEAISYAKDHYSHPGLKYRQMDAQKITSPDNAFDTIFSSENIEHLQEPELCLTHMRRVLKDGGILVMGTPNKEYFSPGMEETSNEFHPHEFYFEDIEEMLKQHFESVFIFENTVESESPLGREMKEDRRKRGKLGILPELDQKTITLGGRQVDLTYLNNTHSFMTLSW